MGPDCYLLLQLGQRHLPELDQELHMWDLIANYSNNRSSTTSVQVGPDFYLLLQQEQHHLPDELDTGGT